jgi:hypothetical protein
MRRTFDQYIHLSDAQVSDFTLARFGEPIYFCSWPNLFQRNLDSGSERGRFHPRFLCTGIWKEACHGPKSLLITPSMTKHWPDRLAEMRALADTLKDLEAISITTTQACFEG